MNEREWAELQQLWKSAPAPAEPVAIELRRLGRWRRWFALEVIIEAVITDRGEVVSPRVLKSTTESMLNQAALDAVRQWRYEPARFRGQPVRVYVTVTVTFRLN